MLNWRKWHRWVGLVVGLQVLLWTAGGVYMSAIPLDYVHGKHLLAPVADIEPPASPVLARLDMGQYQSVRWVNRAGTATIEAVTSTNQTQFLDLTTVPFKVLDKLEQAELTALAVQQYLGSGDFKSIKFMESPPAEASGISIPVYQVQFNDWCNTTFYMHPYTGAVLKVRSDIWRLFDIFWMLHIMDYEARSDINNPLLIASALTALFFTVTGMMLIFIWIARALRRQRALANI